MGQTKNNQTMPRSMRQKQILDIAAERPNVSKEEIAAEVPSATTDLVGRVLGEFGDPASDIADDSSVSNNEADQFETISLDPEQLSSMELELLRLIYEYPQASQRKLGEMLDVSRTTVSNRANSIEGFDWKDRLKFAEAIFETDAVETGDEYARKSMSDGKYSPSSDTIQNRVATLEQQIEELAKNRETGSIFANLELTHKIVHACMESETITKDEELKILKTFLD